MKKSVENLVHPEGIYKITAYDSKKHEVTGLIYDKGRYEVTFTKSGDDITWDVDYRLRVYTYDDKEEDLK